MPGADRDIEVSVRVEAPPDALWDLVADVTRMGEWSPECRRCRWVGKRREPVPGARFVGVNKRGPLWWVTRNVVEEAVRGEAFAFRTREAGATWTYRFTPDGTGTLVTESRTVGTVPRVSQLAVKALMGGQQAHDEAIARGMRETLDRIKAAAEAAPATA